MNVFSLSHSLSLECLCLTTVLKNTRYFCLIRLNVCIMLHLAQNQELINSEIISLIK